MATSGSSVTVKTQLHSFSPRIFKSSTKIKTLLKTSLNDQENIIQLSSFITLCQRATPVEIVEKRLWTIYFFISFA